MVPALHVRSRAAAATPAAPAYRPAAASGPGQRHDRRQLRVQHDHLSSRCTPGTTYYYCAIASNTFGTSFGSVLSFTTLPALPSVSTSSATAITAGGATLNGSASPGGGATTGWFRYSTTNPVTCNDTFGTRAPATGGSSLGVGPDGRRVLAGDHRPRPGDDLLLLRDRAELGGTGFGGVGSFVTPSAPTVTTSAASAISNIQAQLNGTANPNGDSASGWFRLGTTNPGTCNDMFGTRVPTVGIVTLGAGTRATSYSNPASGLSPEHHLLLLRDRLELARDGVRPVLSFTTFDQPAVTTAAATSVASNSAHAERLGQPERRLGDRAGSATPRPTRAPATTRSARACRPAAAPTWAPAGPPSTTRSAPASTSRCRPGTTYYYCAIAIERLRHRVRRGAVVHDAGRPAPVSTGSATAADGARRATINGSGEPGRRDDDRAGSATARPTRAAATTRSARALPLTGGTALGAGQRQRPVLAGADGPRRRATTYYYCAIALELAWARCSAALGSFTTPSAPTVTTNAASGVGDTTATLNGSANPNGDRRPAGSATARPARAPATTRSARARRPSGGTALGVGQQRASAFAQAVTGLTAEHDVLLLRDRVELARASASARCCRSRRARRAAVTTLAATSVTTTTAHAQRLGQPERRGDDRLVPLHHDRPGHLQRHVRHARSGERRPANLGSGTAPSPSPSTRQPTSRLTPGTTYYYCAIAHERFGTAFGAVLSFTTPPAPPVVTTSAATAVTEHHGDAQRLGQPGRRRHHRLVPLQRHQPGHLQRHLRHARPGDRRHRPRRGQHVGRRTRRRSPASRRGRRTTSARSPRTRWARRSAALHSFTTPTAPTVTTNAPLGGQRHHGDAQRHGATRTARRPPAGSATAPPTRAPATTRSARARRRPAAPTWARAAARPSYTQPVTGLTPVTTYYFCAIASNSLGTAFGTVRDVHDAATEPAVTTAAATSLASTSAHAQRHRRTRTAPRPPAGSAIARPTRAPATTASAPRIPTSSSHEPGQRHHRRELRVQHDQLIGADAGHDLLLLRDREQRRTAPAFGTRADVHDPAGGADR